MSLTTGDDASDDTTLVEWLAVRAALHAYLTDGIHEPLNIAHGLLLSSWLAHLR